MRKPELTDYCASCGNLRGDHPLFGCKGFRQLSADTIEMLERIDLANVGINHVHK